LRPILALLAYALVAVIARGAGLPGDQIRGPRLTDRDFFAALDLTRPGLEQVAAAIAAGDYARAKAELLAYYRTRPDSTGHGERRPGPRNEKPSLAALTSWNGFAHALTVDWTGWKRFQLTKRDFITVHRPMGWDFIRYVTFTLDDPGQNTHCDADLYLDDLRLTGPGGTVDLGGFEEGLGAWEGLETNADRAHSGQRSGRWVNSPASRLVRNAGLIHDWTGYDTLEFWMDSPAATGARISVVLDSEDLEFPETAQDVLDHRELVFVKPDYFVVVDKLEGEGVHEIESLFHLNHEEAEIEGPVARSVDPGVSNVVVAAAPVEALRVRIAKGETTPEVQGFIPSERWRASWRSPQTRSPEHGKRAVPTVIYTLRTTLPAKLVYVLMPCPVGKRLEVTCRLLPVEGPGTAVHVSLPAGQQRAVLIGKPGQHVSCGAMGTQRQVAVFDTSGPSPRLVSEL